ncbi:nucleotidyltransferase domain-containing protein [Pararhizobium sp. BT-229]|uniref:nucleotidyltransferase domain-containing protein n=1 Tax=Pararhizobium sp. BT-229 TaxID=2986923 RepID=UPI0021F783EC|nr:nucleotidyltransferase domain-containing protein [Pararhizobium sp. BT-229]MCV9964920.1 nucleotidyltransferase domain-containing protein [Pararhizobium sp. BT-229]
MFAFPNEQGIIKASKLSAFSWDKAGWVSPWTATTVSQGAASPFWVGRYLFLVKHAKDLTFWQWQMQLPAVGMILPKMGTHMSSIDFLLSQRQQKVLRALILQGEASFSVSDLIRIAGPGNGATQRVLDSFEAAGIVKKRAQGNQRIYSINLEHPIYPELRSICIKTFGVADVIAKELEPFESRIETAFVFGSMAKGEERPGSDVDLMVVGDIDYFELGEALERMQAELGRDIDLNLHSPKEWQALQGDRVIQAIESDQKIMVSGR